MSFTMPEKFSKTCLLLAQNLQWALSRKSNAQRYSGKKAARMALLSGDGAQRRTAWRILYHSLDAERHNVTTSAFVLLPAGPAPAGGWPMVAWAHGTSGVAQPCAPSLMKDLYYGDEGLFEFPKAGLAVVATDYHGEGTPGAHQYMNKLAQGYDVIYSVAAAHEALPGILSQKWVADGHSQGGMASWSVGEMEQQIKTRIIWEPSPCPARSTCSISLLPSPKKLEPPSTSPWWPMV